MKAYGKAILRSVLHSKSRFFAIFAIVALGAGFFAGISSAAPDMRQTVDQYLDQQNFMDVELLSTLGFSKQDVQAVSSAAGVRAVMPTWYEDVTSRINSEDVVLRVHALPEQGAEDTGAASMNRPVLVSGRWPQSAQECVLDQKKSLVSGGLKVGDRITVQEPNGQSSLRQKTFRVVGFVKSPMYLSFTLGNTNIGSGQISRYLYVQPQVFSSAAYTQLFVTVKDAAGLNSFSQAYRDKVQAVCDTLTAVGKTRAPLRREEVVADSREKLEDSRKTYESSKAEADKKFAQAKTQLQNAQAQIAQNAEKLDTAQRQITEGSAKLTEAKTAYETGLQQYTAQKQQAESKLADASAQLRAGREAITSAQQRIADGQAQLDAQTKKLTDAKAQLDSQEKQLDAAQVQWEQSQQKLADAADAIAQARASLSQLEAAGQGATQDAAALRSQIAAYDQQTAELQSAKTELAQNREKLQQAQQAYQQQATAAKPRLQQAQQKIADAQNQLSKQQQKLADGEAAYRTQRQVAQEQLAAAKQKLDTAASQISQETKELEQAKTQLFAGKAALQTARQTLQKNQTAYQTSKEETDAQLQKAQKQLADGEAALKAVEKPSWYVLDRDKNLGYNSFTGDADRMESISHMFPVFFFLVAALVVLTSMTRMVDEERLQIGTYKALGFPGKAIARKYLLYALIVSLSGSVTGIIIGCLTLPSICWNAYRLMYSAPALVPHIDSFYAGMGCLTAAAVTLLATWAACRAVLLERPTSLLQPQAPKPGRRILLERFTPVWRHLNFTAKVTARNLFRYKRRLIMTIVGIAGCTALILTGFGIKDSVTHIVTNQYDDLCQYNMDISLQAKTGLSDSAKSVLNDKKRISSWMSYAVRSADMENKSGKIMSANLLVPQHTADLPHFIRLRDRRTKTPVAFTSSSVVVTEKLANRLGLKVGSQVIVPDADGKKYAFTVTGITENYIYHYVYIAPELYEKVTGQTPSYTGVWASEAVAKSGRAQLSRDLLNAKGVTTAIYIDEVAANFDSMIQALNMITLVLILCAGMLSFVVLYNLTNINITERMREMATLRVLGFYERETAGYIYRETTVLTLLGCVCGLVLGIFMHRAVITTVEVDVCMFGRNISPTSYLWSILLTLGFTLAVDLLMYPKFRKINMVESLKSVD
ncbi:MULTISPECIES: FtsX-like permease family protein [Caproicibacterium]|uniref:FtsX-like permease family protein n=1 Tax=Caproicibacterium argilliputei TaxID=3030016 RepID=A0AA97D9V1_9FIRM|nr:FtsX-like permease family protein [Caproicibacterium argilliputei]WOC32307.1 FtsX-like permease family protein [Caproicibacterium argilliputei]